MVFWLFFQLCNRVRALPQKNIPQGLKPSDFIGLIGILRLRSGQAKSRALTQSLRN
jgi:hypothetical protein